MNILGIGFLSESSACIVQDGKLVAAVSEERLNRRKLWYGFPEEAIAEVLRIAGLTIDQIDWVATHGLCPKSPDAEPFGRKVREVMASDLNEDHKARLCDGIMERFAHETRVFSQRTPNYLHQVRSLNRPVKIYGHHHAHAASAFYGSGFSDCLVMTADGWGEDGSHTLYEANQHGMTRLAHSSTIDSLGYFYGSITKALGFTPHRHEGKVLGLAAYCPDPQSYPDIRAMLDVNRNGFVGNIDGGLYLPSYDNMALLRLARNYSREDIASAAQMTLEDVVCRYVASLGTKANRLAVAGGIFANVKLNQRIKEYVDELFVFPNMGDGGLSVGAAWLAYHELTGQRPKRINTMFLGSEITDEERILSEVGLPFRERKNIADDIAELLSRGEVVARCTGPMEFGPRALGHRSILYQATDPSANDWLNARLHRSEFMPFAPATLESAGSLMYEGYQSDPGNAAYMTRTYNCTARMREEAPAAVHVDNTARPQVVWHESAPDLYDILLAYKKRTGLSSIINTSFNMHEEPIVCTAQDAVRAFLASRLKYLALGNFLVEMEDAPVRAKEKRELEMV